jgi:uncharacterized protein YfaS (alpha-2-macroglobulin family)
MKKSMFGILSIIPMLLCLPLAISLAQGNNSLIPSSLEARIIGQNRWLIGSPVALRIIVTNHQTGKPIASTVKLTLTSTDQEHTTWQLMTSKTDSLGTLDAKLKVPSASPGSYILDIEIASAIGADKLSLPITLSKGARILLTCDKPIYQPSQTIHMRVLAMDEGTNRPISEEPVTFEVEDARGNKVFKNTQTLSSYGVASADFVLADEVNMGVFTLRAILPDASAEKKVDVKRYVLPKFKISFTPDKEWYLPGEILHGTVHAEYFFGKPVAGGTVTAKLSTMDVTVSELKDITGKTDENGNWQFDYELPLNFIGQPLTQGQASLDVNINVKDTAEHSQEMDRILPVVKNPISIVTVPETQSIVPNVKNRLYISAASPNGEPLKHITLNVSLDNGARSQKLETDDLGIAVYEFTPAPKHDYKVVINAQDHSGRKTQYETTLRQSSIPEGIILRANQTIAKVGQKLRFTILSSVESGSVYLDVLRDNQTILTKAMDIKHGEGSFSLTATPDMTGTIRVDAYQILPNEDIIRDMRTLVISPADDLKITAIADQAVYRPGSDATIQFLVRDSQNRPIAAALGLSVVDESVYALAELKPGLEKIYFTLERDLMEPKYEIHGLKPSFLIHPPLRRDIVFTDPEKQRAAAMLFAAVPERPEDTLNMNTWMQHWEAIRTKAVTIMQRSWQQIRDAIAQYNKNNQTPLTDKNALSVLHQAGFLTTQQTLDPWGHPYRINSDGVFPRLGYFTLSSAGPDGKWNTEDDITDITPWGGPIRGLAMEDGIGPVMMPRGGAMAGGIGGFGRPMMLEEKAAAPMMRLQVSNAAIARTNQEASNVAQENTAPRTREYFPETMYWNPTLITDNAGRAEIKIPMADSITTWRMSMMADSATGLLGSGDVSIKCFQPFFVDIDLPISLTANDQVSIPVALYNYLKESQTVTLILSKGDWFTVSGSLTVKILMKPGEVKVHYFPITVQGIGNHVLKVTAIGPKFSDAIQRNIQVLPDGKEKRSVINDSLSDSVQKTVTIPADAIPDASNLWVKLYPGVFSQVVDGLDSLLRMPNGCFEQTSSTTYPNVLILNYLKSIKKLNPEIQMKAEGYINIGYQRLVTFECKSGGFSWFGNEPANQILTAYGLLEFTDMSHVYNVDPALITRTAQWLANQQNADGSWLETHQGIAEGIINRQTGALRTTAYVGWALNESGYQGPALQKGLEYVKTHLAEAKDPYTLAVILNFLDGAAKGDAITDKVANDLISLAKTDDKTAWWESDTQTFTGAVKASADLETTGLAAYGLVRWGGNPEFTNKALAKLVQSKDSYGSWSTTQGTVWSLKALLYASTNGTGTADGKVTIAANGTQATSIDITPENSDVMHQVDLTQYLKPGDNQISLRFQGKGNLSYQIVDRYYEPWNQMPMPARPILSIDVNYDKHLLAQNDSATVTATVKNMTGEVAEMPLIDLGVPPGFTVLPDKLDALVKQGTISKYTIAARQVIIYMQKLDPGQQVAISYDVQANYPIKALTPLSKAYPYYNPEEVAISSPQQITVR